jgi:hypothetical protein
MIAVEERKQVSKRRVGRVVPTTTTVGVLWPMVHTQLNRNRQQLLREKFENYYSKWKDQTRFLSMANSITENENFQAIINMKEDATPFIIEKLEEGPSFLVVALNAIYNKRMSDQPISFEEARQLWLKALRK